MKILFCSNTTWSMVNYRMGLLQHLRESGHDVAILAPLDDAVEKLRKIGVQVDHLNLDARNINPLRDLRLLWDMYCYYRRAAPDIVIHYTIKPNIYGSMAAQAAGIPSLCVTTGLGYTFINENWISGGARWLYRRAFRYPREVWFLNEDDRQAFLEKMLVAEEKTRILKGEGVNTDYFSPRPKPVEDGRQRFLLIARLLWDKGVSEFVAAARKLKQQFPNACFQLLGACDSPNPSAISRGQLAAWQQEEVIEYLGVAEDVRPYIAAADCVVLPSYREGMPRTMLEAAAMARPLIVTDVPGCRDVVRQGETGLMCPPQDADALADCMEVMLTMPLERRLRMGEAGRRFVCENFSEAQAIKHYLQFLQTLPNP